MSNALCRELCFNNDHVASVEDQASALEETEDFNASALEADDVELVAMTADSSKVRMVRLWGSSSIQGTL